MSGINMTIEYLENLIASLPGHVYWLDINNIYLGCNNLQAQSAGLNSREEIVGKKNKDLPWNKSNPELVEALDKVNTEIVKSGIARSIEEPALRLDGSKAIFLSHKCPIKDKDGEVIGLLGTSIDITARKTREDKLLAEKEQMELTLEHIIANMPGHVYWKNSEGIYLGCNDSQALSLGLKHDFEVIGKTDFELPWENEAAQIFRENDIRVMTSGEAIKIEEKSLIDGKQGFVLSHKVPLRDKKNNTIGVVGISIDITNLKETEKNLIAAKEAAEAANKAKTEFLYNMKHDLRTPFSGILGIAEFLESTETDLDKKENLSYVVEGAKVLLNHLNEIFEFIHTENGQLPILEKQFDLHKVLQDIYKMMAPSAKDKGINFAWQVHDNLPQYVIGDRVRTHRILMNIVSNAIKFTQQGHVKLSAEVVRQANKQVIVKFTIEDTGVGIPEDKQDFIFEQFNRLTSAYSGVYSGKGLGLRMVKHFLDEIGGEAHIESKVSKGSIFKILIPFRHTLLDCPEEQL